MCTAAQDRTRRCASNEGNQHLVPRWACFRLLVILPIQTSILVSSYVHFLESQLLQVARVGWGAHNLEYALIALSVVDTCLICTMNAAALAGQQQMPSKWDTRSNLLQMPSGVYTLGCQETQMTKNLKLQWKSCSPCSRLKA